MAFDESMGAGVQKRTDPHCTVIAFAHGDLVVSGPQLPDTLIGVAEATAYLLDEKLKVVETHVENVVAETSLGQAVDLNAAAEAFGADPPGPGKADAFLELGFPETGAKMALFPSGRIVLNGAKTEEEINRMMQTVLDALGLELE